MHTTGKKNNNNPKIKRKKINRFFFSVQFPSVHIGCASDYCECACVFCLHLHSVSCSLYDVCCLCIKISNGKFIAILEQSKNGKKKRKCLEMKIYEKKGKIQYVKLTKWEIAG